MSLLNKLFFNILALTCVLLMTACSPEVGSDSWCDELKEKPKGEWTANEAKSYAQHCLFN